MATLIKSIKRVIILLMFLPVLALAEGGEINTINVVQDTLSATTSCIHYKVVGACFWFDWWDGFSSTLKVDHYMPDTVVSVYNHNGSDPWWYANKIIDPAAHKAGQMEVRAEDGNEMKDSNEQSTSVRDTNDYFKEVDIIGNPAITLLDHLFLLIPSTANPFVPYYSSMLDAIAWRSPLAEMFYPQSLIPGVDDVGSFPLNVWGNVYPRTGFINQLVDGKAAAVIAERSADIMTKSTQPHIYHKLTSDCGSHCMAYKAKENSKNILWQMIYPKNEKKCVVFGANSSRNSKPWESDATKKGKGNYAWVMWRHYHGCIQGDGHYVGSISF
ncbi:MAG: TIGR03756 family integrating conjugative element protein [Gammaproteobacteria bacterium]|nr:TIGR03756 family integrating conjugative element protein [Gammaproteobacteria bacterium]